MYRKGGLLLSVWWSNVDSFEKFFWYIAVPFSLTFLIQLIFTFLGIGDSDGMDIDLDSDGVTDILDADGGPFNFFTVRNFLAFFMIFGWSGITYYNYGFSKTKTAVLAFISGIIAMLIVAFLFYYMMKLSQSGNMNLNYAPGKYGQVYIPIPEARRGSGKIQITFQGALREIEAVTDGERLSTGARVKVIKVLDDSTLLVEEE